MFFGDLVVEEILDFLMLDSYVLDVDLKGLEKYVKVMINGLVMKYYWVEECKECYLVNCVNEYSVEMFESLVKVKESESFLNDYDVVILE